MLPQLILRDNKKEAKFKLLTENNLLDSTSLWIKSELMIDTSPGLSERCFGQPE